LPVFEFVSVAVATTKCTSGKHYFENNKIAPEAFPAHYDN